MPKVNGKHKRETYVTAQDGGPLYKDSSFPWSLDARNTKLTPYLAKVVDGIKEVAKELKLKLEYSDLKELVETGGHLPIYSRNPPKNKSLKHKAGDSPRFGSGGAAKTQEKKETDIRMLWNFCAIIGDYESMLLLLPTCPKPICPSMNQKTLFLFADFLFRQQKDNPHIPLMDLEKGEQVKDIFEKPMLTQGSRADPMNLNKIFSTVSDLHKIRKQEGSYQERCQQCFELFTNNMTDEGPPSCIHCQVNHFCRRGNPARENKVLINKKVEIRDKGLSNGHKIIRANSLLPVDLVDIHNHVSSRNWPQSDMMYWCMTLSGLNATMRYEGMKHTEFEDFELRKELWTVMNGMIHTLSLALMEKRDAKKFIYQLKFNEQVKRFCFLRHIFVYLHCYHDGDSGPLYLESDGKTEVSYKKYNDWMDERLKINCKHGSLGKYGAHSPRRSYYLFSVLGKGNYEDIKRCCRHKTPEVAEQYYEDARIIAEEILNDEELREMNPIWDFDNNLLNNDCVNMRRIRAMQGTAAEFSNLREAATYFVEKMLKVDSKHPSYRDPKFLLERSYKMNFHQDGKAKKADDILKGLIPSERHVMMEHMEEQTRKEVGHLKKDLLEKLDKGDLDGLRLALSGPDGNQHSPTSESFVQLQPLQDAIKIHHSSVDAILSLCPDTAVFGAPVGPLLLLEEAQATNRGSKQQYKVRRDVSYPLLTAASGRGLCIAMSRILHEMMSVLPPEKSKYDPNGTVTLAKWVWQQYKEAKKQLHPSKKWLKDATEFVKELCLAHDGSIDRFMQSNPDFKLKGFRSNVVEN